MKLFDRATAGVEAAQKALSAAESLVGRWEAERAAKTAERDDLATRVGDLVLDDPDAAARLGEQLTRLNTEIDIASRTALSAKARADSLRPPLKRAEAAVKVAEGKALEAEGTREWERTKADLDALAQREGVEFGVLSLPSVDGVARPGLVPLTRSQGTLARARARFSEADALNREADEMEAALGRERVADRA